MKERGRDGMRWLNGLLRAEWVAGPSFSVADIHLYAFLQEMAEKGQPIPDDCATLSSWLEQVGARPAAEMSLWRLQLAEVSETNAPKVST
jgi:glutathione S-transferase